MSAGCSLKKPRVLIVGAFPPPSLNIFGGIATVCRNLVQSSLSDRFELVLVDSTQRGNPLPGIVTRVVFGAWRALVYCKALVSSRPDAVILFCSGRGSVLEKSGLARLAGMAGIPTLVFPRAGGLIDLAAASRFSRLWIRWALKSATYFLCQGPTWHRFAVDVVGFSPSHAPLVPNWTATTRLLSIGSGRVGRSEGHVVQLLFLGWLEREKGIIELLQACAGLSERYDFRLVIAGRGHAEQEARRYVRHYALSDRVEFAGWVHGERLEKLLADSDVLVLPSWAEGLPNAMIEAMSAGLAVIVSAVGNVPDVVTDGCEALLVPPRNVVELQTAIQRLLDDPALLDSIAARGHAFVGKNYAMEPAIEVLSRTIESAITSRQPPFPRPTILDRPR